MRVCIGVDARARRGIRQVRWFKRLETDQTTTGPDAVIEVEEADYPTELPRISEANEQQIRGVTTYVERVQDMHGRAEALDSVRAIIKSTTIRSMPAVPDFIDTRYRIKIKPDHAAELAVAGAGRRLIRACEELRDHLAAVQDGDESLRDDFDRMWLHLEISLEHFQDASSGRDEVLKKLRAPYMKLLSNADKTRLMQEALQGAMDALDGK
jgi:hypothetical protein